MVHDYEDQRKQALDMFIRALSSAPDSLIKSLTGKDYAKHIIEGAQAIEEYIFPKDAPKGRK
jgi:hypothetical protein